MIQYIKNNKRISINTLLTIILFLAIMLLPIVKYDQNLYFSGFDIVFGTHGGEILVFSLLGLYMLLIPLVSLIGLFTKKRVLVLSIILLLVLAVLIMTIPNFIVFSDSFVNDFILNSGLTMTKAQAIAALRKGMSLSIVGIFVVVYTTIVAGSYVYHLIKLVKEEKASKRNKKRR